MSDWSGRFSAGYACGAPSHGVSGLEREVRLRFFQIATIQKITEEMIPAKSKLGAQVLAVYGFIASKNVNEPTAPMARPTMTHAQKVTRLREK